MPTLDVLANSDPALMARLLDLGIPNRALGREIGVNESTVRTWRAKRLQNPQSVSSPQPKHVNGVAQWVPGMDLGKDDGEVRSIPRVVGDGIDEPEDADLMRELGVDPGKWEVIARRESRWQQRDGGDFLRAYRISVRRRGSKTGDLSVEALNEILGAYANPGPAVHKDSDDVFVVALGDLQVGKSDGDGTPGLVDRFGRLTEDVRARLEDAGGARRLVITHLGDCLEGVVAQQGRLAARLDISITEAVRVYRRLLLHQIAALAPHAENVIVVPVAGNHDESYRGVQMPVTDSWALEGASAVEDALALSGKYGHVQFLYPQDEELVTTLDVGVPGQPFVIAFTHGHVVNSPAKMPGWLAGQALGRQSGGDADLLLTGHFHHLRIESVGKARTWVQVPAMDGGSDWYRRKTGSDDAAGMLSMWVTPGRGPGWQRLEVHQ